MHTFSQFLRFLCILDVRESSVLQESASSVGWQVDIDEMIGGLGKEKLLQNTQEALDRGSFGVPRFEEILKALFCDKLHFDNETVEWSVV